MSREETHYLTCNDENCERAYCVDRRHNTSVIQQLREMTAMKDKAAEIAIAIGFEHNQMVKKCTELKAALEGLWAANESGYIEDLMCARRDAKVVLKRYSK